MITDPKTVIAEHFINAISTKNPEALRTLYHTDIIYLDQLYGMLEGADVLHRWEVLFYKDELQSVQCINIHTVDEEYITVNWRMKAVLAITGKPVNLIIKSFFKIVDGLITEQSDAYKLSTVAAQSYGVTGRLLGWTAFMKKRLLSKAAKQLFP